MAFVTKPELPPKEGYIEVIDSEGNHVYKRIPQLWDEEKEALQNQISSLEEVIDTLMLDILPSL